MTATRPQRYDQCDDTCTVDCGHCKGKGRPGGRAMTGTTQPDPQVVAWMRDWLRQNPDGDAASVLLAYARGGLLPLADDADVLVASARAARKPLTVADIPAGQGPASLFVRRDHVGGELDLCFKHADGRVVVIGVTLDQLTGATTAALTDHLSATLPHVTTELAS